MNYPESVAYIANHVVEGWLVVATRVPSPKLAASVKQATRSHTHISYKGCYKTIVICR
ncbi:MAG: hypothetical protein WCC17_03775 [Candidatus Nitrosopolaris sp.]